MIQGCVHTRTSTDINAVINVDTKSYITSKIWNSTDTRTNMLVPVGNSPSIDVCMSTSLRADISIIFICRLVFILLFVLTLVFVLCISISDSARLSIIADFYFIFDLYYYANIFTPVCISKHGCTIVWV